MIKAQTLGATTWQIMLRVVAPQMMPRLIEFGAALARRRLAVLIASEAIASESGLGYRIFLMRRYLAMDVILPYVAWITLLAFLSDYLLAGATSADSTPGSQERAQHDDHQLSKCLEGI